MSNSSITLSIEFLAGTPIEAALTESLSKAVQLDVAYIKFNFNGINVSCSQDFDIEYWTKQYLNVMKDKKTYMICTRRCEK